MNKTYAMPIVEYTPEQMQKRVARFDQLKYPPNRYHDSQLPGNTRKNYLVVGTGLIAPGGTDPWSAIPVKEGFQMSFIKAEPGNGPMRAVKGRSHSVPERPALCRPPSSE